MINKIGNIFNIFFCSNGSLYRYSIELGDKDLPEIEFTLSSYN